MLAFGQRLHGADHVQRAAQRKVDGIAVQVARREDLPVAQIDADGVQRHLHAVKGDGLHAGDGGVTQPVLQLKLDATRRVLETAEGV